jgi:hypothetical protein
VALPGRHRRACLELLSRPPAAGMLPPEMQKTPGGADGAQPRVCIWRYGESHSCDARQDYLWVFNGRGAMRISYQAKASLAIATIVFSAAFLAQTSPSKTADPLQSGDVGTLSCQTQGFGTGDQCYTRCVQGTCQTRTCLRDGGWMSFGSCRLYGDWADCPARRCP